MICFVRVWFLLARMSNKMCVLAYMFRGVAWGGADVEAALLESMCTEDSRFFGLSAGFDSFSNAGKELIIQYQAKYEKDIECGGGYVKVGPKLSDPKTFGDPTPYNIMFGPDKCGYTKRTHLIFSYKGKNVLKKSDLAYKQEGEGTSHVQLGSRLHAQ